MKWDELKVSLDDVTTKAQQFRSKLTNSMEQSPSWVAVTHSDNQEILRIPRNPKAHHHFHKCSTNFEALYIIS
jgi:hypothetical protein